MRLRILDILSAKPRNAHQLSQDLGVDYKTAEHHLRVLGKSQLVAGGEGYGGLYRLSPLLASQWLALRAELFGQTQIKRRSESRL